MASLHHPQRGSRTLDPPRLPLASHGGSLGVLESAHRSVHACAGEQIRPASVAPRGARLRQASASARLGMRFTRNRDLM
ncbi:uncharacterized protein SOCE26_045170 [Sorangium cellulosum]|uniref:Uncharacterized protein n=1 Tax=Sorangium cellulosum TaxID=56 RepID=A0A2L0EUV2_SORCE|nr:uncharacterized protein SOCE26_045170 [Sorangium cellulosum]